MVVNNLIARFISIIPTFRIISFLSQPDYSDNSYAIFNYLLENNYNKKYKFVWLFNDKNSIRSVRQDLSKKGIKCKFFYKYSLLGLFYGFISRYIFCTHGYLNNIPMRQHPRKIINMWHGMPFKRIGLMDVHEKSSIYCPSTNVLLSTSEIFQDLMSQSFGRSKDVIPITGQPRNDLLFEDTSFFQEYNIKRCDFSKVGIWLPTYRSSIYGEKRCDGDYKDGQIGFLEDKELDYLNNFLCEIKTLLIIKLHPFDRSQLYNFNQYSNIIILKPKDFKVQLYPLLGQCDFLLTDYSSVWIDYEILNRPIGFVMDDISKYKKDRGFSFENPLEILPGTIIQNLEQLKSFINNPIVTPSVLEFNKYKDCNSSERLVKFLNL